MADDEEDFDWHQDFESLRAILTSNGCTPGKKVLIIGCGNCSKPATHPADGAIRELYSRCNSSSFRIGQFHRGPQSESVESLALQRHRLG